MTKTVKVFNVGDEFLIHCFKAHFIARICSILGVTSPADHIEHPADLEWLKTKAKYIVQHIPSSRVILYILSTEHFYTWHSSILICAELSDGRMVYV